MDFIPYHRGKFEKQIMKKVILLASMLACWVASLPLLAQEGVNFRRLSLEQALERARAESKLVMVDCQTSWCGPCKYMSGTVFPRKEAGDFFNRHFVSVEFDMEKGEGIQIREKYGVRFFPTFLFLEPSGVERYRVVGSGELAEFIPRAKRALEARNARATLEREYASGKMRKDRKLTYVIALQDACSDEAVKVREELLADLTPAEKLSATFWPLIDDEYNAASIETLIFVAENRGKLKKSIGEKKVSLFLEKGYATLLRECTRGEMKAGEAARLVAVINDHVAKNYLTLDDGLKFKLQLADAVAKNELERVVVLIDENLSALPVPDLFEYMSLFARLDTKDKELMRKVVKVGAVIVANCPEGETRTAVERYFERYEKAAATGVYWEKRTLEEALAEAGKSGKFVFMDCYTTCSGPCAYMANTIFPRAEVGEFFNEHFINVKYDMEAGDGPEIARRYNVGAYPTFILLRPDGSVQHKIVGSSEEIVEEIREGLDDERASGTLDRKYAGGARDKDFLTAYLRQLLDFNETDKAREVYDALSPFLNDAEKTSEKYWFIYENDTFSGEGSENFNYLLERKKTFEKSVGKLLVDRRIADIYVRKLYPILLEKETPAPGYLQKMKKELASYKLTEEKELLACIDLVNGYVEGDANKLLKTCSRVFRYMTEEHADIAIFMLRYLKKNTTAKQLPELEKLAAGIMKKLTVDEFKQIITAILEEN